MNPSILWALGSTFGAAVNDLLFKRFTRRPGSLGIFVAGTGLVWALLLLGMDGVRVAAPNRLTLAYGIPAGLFSVAANILLICALAGMDASVGATIYRLNFIPVMCLAVLLLGEHLNAVKLGGLAAAAAAVFLFARDGRRKKQQTSLIFLLLAVSACILRAGMGIAYKLALLRGVDCDSFLFVNALCWLGGGFLWAALQERRLRFDGHTARYALLSGVLVAEIVFTLARGLQSGQASIVVPITQLSFLCTALFSALFLKERLTGVRICGLACGAAAVFALMHA